MSLPLRAFLLLLFLLFFSSFGPAQTEVVRSVSDCADFLLDQTAPQIPQILHDGKILDQVRYKPICQTYRDTRTFLTLYDTTERIPVFSAIKFVQNQNSGKRPKKWMIEPQLENKSADKNMKEDTKKQGTFEHQASNFDYINSSFSRGHLCPSSYASTQTAKNSTFTLTNIVPQVQSFNDGSWEKMETCIKCFMKTFCRNSMGATEGFVVTGAKPDQSSIKLKIRVNVPSELWSAFCCYSDAQNVWLASAHWGKNVADESKNKHLQTKSLNDLYGHLGTPTFNIFPGTKCPLDTNVSNLYPELDKTCKCPTVKQKNNFMF